jgi:uncharacterized phage protein (TIGR01671 family)
VGIDILTDSKIPAGYRSSAGSQVEVAGIQVISAAKPTDRKVKMEIKFRALHIKTGEWWYGSAGVDYNSSFTGVHVYTMEFFLRCIRRGILDAKTIGLYVNIDDKTGKEIFVGDIFKAQYKEATVVDDDGFARDVHEEVNHVSAVKDIFTLREGMGGNLRNGGHWHYPFIEIIGDIYHNPELLK